MANQVAVVEVPFGSRTDSVLQVRSTDQLELGCGLPRVEDVRSAVRTALREPIEFPPVEQSIVEGDRVVLAVDPSVPQMTRVVLSVLEYLHDAGSTIDQFAIVIAGHDQRDADRLQSELAGSLFSGITIEMHDADDTAKLAYVAANKQGDPIYLNRTMVDADVVISVMCARAQVAFDYQGAYGIFPLLSDRKTRGQFFSLKHLADSTEHRRLQSWADEAAWWGGMLVTVQVIPASGGGVSAVLAGGVQELEPVVQQKFSEAWMTSVEGTFDAVAVLIDGDQAQQTWDNVARALSLAVPFVNPDGIIVVCSELEQSPGSALRRLADPSRSEEEFRRKLSHNTADDALAASVLLETSSICHVYLLSDLDREEIESLGMGALKSPAEAEHALQDRGRVLVLGTAQHRTRTVVDAAHECSSGADCCGHSHHHG